MDTLHILYKVFVVTIYDYQQKPHNLFCCPRAGDITINGIYRYRLYFIVSEATISLLAEAILSLTSQYVCAAATVATILLLLKGYR